MLSLRPFEIILITVFLALAVGGVIFFATFQNSASRSLPYGERVLIWGTLDRNAFIETFFSIGENDPKFSDVVTYQQKDERTFESEFVNAIAEGNGPDLVLLPHDMLLGQRGKLTPLSYENFPLRNYRDLFIDGAEIFLAPEGIYGLPILVDPLVMYWNRDIFASRGLASPPNSWEELIARTVPAITERTPSLDIVRSTIAFGEYANVKNAKETLSLLILQAGNKIVFQSERGITVDLRGDGAGTGSPPAEAALKFYTEFSNPAKNTYSWNRAQPLDERAFLAEDLALYFGFGSELNRLRKGNPNFNFDMAEVPQGAGASLKDGYGRFYALAIVRSTPNPAGSYRAVLKLIDTAPASFLAKGLNIAPVHRSLLSSGSADPFEEIIYRAALVTRGWLDPNPSASDDIFRAMIEDVNTGRNTIGGAIGDAEKKFRNLIQ